MASGADFGMQTLSFGRLFPDCTITGSDLHQPFLIDLTLQCHHE